MKARHHRAVRTARRQARPRPRGRRVLESREIESRPDVGSSSPTESARGCYACSKCRFRSDLEEPDWKDSKLPVWNPKGKRPEDCWSECPMDGGPDTDYLVHPDRLYMCQRITFRLHGKRVRACTPVMIHDKRPDGSFRVQRVLSPEWMWREIYLSDYLKMHGHDREINLQRLRDAAL